MKIGFHLGTGDLLAPEVYGPLVKSADEVGFSTLWLGEHVATFEEFDAEYPYARGEKLPPVPLDAILPNPYVALAFAAGVTTRLRLATGVSIIPAYHPLMLGKIVASVDSMSHGRLVLGVGTGWLDEEFDAIDVPRERRAARLKDSVAAMRKIWGPGTATHQGEFFAFDDAISSPKPARGASLPIVYGGNSSIAIKRAADYCDGLYMFNVTPQETADIIATTRQLLENNGRATDPFEFIINPLLDCTPNDLAAYHDAGAHELVLFPHHLMEAGALEPGGTAAAMMRLAEQWLVPAGDLVGQS